MYSTVLRMYMYYMGGRERELMKMYMYLFFVFCVAISMIQLLQSETTIAHRPPLHTNKHSRLP